MAEIVTQPIPPVPSAMHLTDRGEVISQPWQQWFINLRDKINTINANLIGWSNVPINSGVTPGTYGDTTHYPVVTVDVHGLVTSAGVEPISSGGAPVKVTFQTTSYTATATDAPAGSSYKGAIGITSASAATLTIPDNTSVPFPIGTELTGLQLGSGTVSFVNATGVTLEGPTITPGGLYASGKALKILTNTWIISGSLGFTNVNGYNAAVIADGAIAFWPLQETSGTTATELVAGLNGTYAGGYTLNQAGPSGLGGKAVQFNGSTAKVTTAASTIISGASFSVEVWLNVSSYAGQVAFGHNGTSTFEIQVGGTNQMLLNFSGSFILGSTTGQATGSFLHVVFTSDLSGTKCYLNGTLNNSNTTAWHGGTSASAIFALGSRSGTSAFFSGYIAAASVYNTVLTPAQIANHYSLGV